MTPHDELRSIEPILRGARATWKAGIARDEERAYASELRLRKIGTKTEPAARSPRHLLRDALPVAACLALVVLGGVALSRRSGPASPDLIRADPQPIATLAVPSVAAVAGRSGAAVTARSSGASDAPDTPTPTALRAIDPNKPSAPKPPPTGAPPSSNAPSVREVLPPLPPPETPRDKRGAASHLAKLGGDRESLETAASEMARGDVERARDRLRLLAVHGDSELAFEAASALASTLRDPYAELAVWDQVLGRPLSEPFQSQARAARQRVIVRMGASSIPTAPPSPLASSPLASSPRVPSPRVPSPRVPSPRVSSPGVLVLPSPAVEPTATPVTPGAGAGSRPPVPPQAPAAPPKLP